MQTVNNATPYDPVQMANAIFELGEQNRIKDLKIDFLLEQNRLLLAQLYSKRSEKGPSFEVNKDQVSYMDPLSEDPECEEEALGEVVTVSPQEGKKKGRKPLPKELPREEMIIDLSEKEKRCDCGAELHRIGAETSEKLKFIPATLIVRKLIRYKYACKSCEGMDSDGPVVKIAPTPKVIIPKSIATPELLAQIVTAKFVDALPFYRQETQFKRLGYELSRVNMANWTIQLGVALERLIRLLHREVLSGPLINIDETTFQVLKEIRRAPTSKSYMWVLRGGMPGKEGVLFVYHPTRGGVVAQELLQGYEGIVQSDGYVGYDFLDHQTGVYHMGCWAHARRKFKDVVKAKKKGSKPGFAEKALTFIGQLYGIEQKATREALTAEQRTEVRLKESIPILKNFHEQLNTMQAQVVGSGLLGKAIAYTLNQWDRLNIFTKYGHVPMDNNLAENVIRPFVIGRKNWLFSDTVAGAQASACLYSLIETATS